MPTTEEHYEQLLAKHYTWMFGTSFDEKVAEQTSLLSKALQTHSGKQQSLAIDLGSGPGFQTIALAQLGFTPVIAIDTSLELLEELCSHAKDLPIQTHHKDLRELPKIAAPAEASVIVCMGDTLTHLPDRDDVSNLFQAVSSTLAHGGTFLITYRDLTPQLQGTDRFIPVRSDENTIMTCFLEYESPESVIVHDLIHTREQTGWTLNKSSYRKLRLSPQWLVQELTAAGLTVESQAPAGRLTQIVATKP